MFTVGSLISTFMGLDLHTTFTIKSDRNYIFRGYREDIPEKFFYLYVMFFEMIDENEIRIEVF